MGKGLFALLSTAVVAEPLCVATSLETCAKTLSPVLPQGKSR